MTGALDEALAALLRSALPALFGGGTPLARVAVAVQGFALDAAGVDAEAGQPRSDAASDLLPFDAAAPQGPYTVTRPPDESLRLVRLATAAGDRIALKPGEVPWDPADARRFTLALRPDRDLAAVSGVLVLDGVTAVFANLKYTQDLAVVLESSASRSTQRACGARAPDPAFLGVAQALRRLAPPAFAGGALRCNSTCLPLSGLLGAGLAGVRREQRQAGPPAPLRSRIMAPSDVGPPPQEIDDEGLAAARSGSPCRPARVRERAGAGARGRRRAAVGGDERGPGRSRVPRGTTASRRSGCGCGDKGAGTAVGEVRDEGQLARIV